MSLCFYLSFSFLFVERDDVLYVCNNHVNDIFQGGIDEGEDPRNAAIRELREETGVNSAEVIAEVQIIHFFTC